MREAMLAAYRRHGYEIRCGEMVTRHLRDGTLNREAVLSECASAWKDGRRLDTGWGMSWQELAVLEFLAGIWRPRRIFGIGNGFGWSALAMDLLWPSVYLRMMDNQSEGADAKTACDLTSTILDEHNSGIVLIGTSPADVPDCMADDGFAPVGLVLIDAQHTDESQFADYRAVKPFLAPEHVILFHDVLFCHMEASFATIATAYPGRSRILRRTTTGMGIVWTADAGRRCAEVFGG